MDNFWSILMFLVLLKPVRLAEFKYVCVVWIGNIYVDRRVEGRFKYLQSFYFDAENSPRSELRNNN